MANNVTLEDALKLVEKVKDWTYHPENHDYCEHLDSVIGGVYIEINKFRGLKRYKYKINLKDIEETENKATFCLSDNREETYSKIADLYKGIVEKLQKTDSLTEKVMKILGEK